MFIRDHHGLAVFSGGQEDWERVAHVASSCGRFRADVEEEWVADERLSCYNCRYRRWTAASFACLKA